MKLPSSSGSRSIWARTTSPAGSGIDLLNQAGQLAEEEHALVAGPGWLAEPEVGSQTHCGEAVGLATPASDVAIALVIDPGHAVLIASCAVFTEPVS